MAVDSKPSFPIVSQGNSRGPLCLLAASFSDLCVHRNRHSLTKRSSLELLRFDVPEPRLCVRVSPSASSGSAVMLLRPTGRSGETPKLVEKRLKES